MVTARGRVLTGKYGRADLDVGEGAPSSGVTRKNIAVANGAPTERGLAIAEVVTQVASELGTTSSRVAVAWTLLNSAVIAD